VLREKPLCGNLGDARRVLDAARQSGTPLWEAFVFPLHRQIAQIHDLMADGAILRPGNAPSHRHGSRLAG
jgi:predicted dehydrogenase